MRDAYVLVTAARNESGYLEKTLAAVGAQTVLPRRWVIVDNGSTDNTARHAQDAARHYDFIRVLSTPAPAERTFAAKALAIEAALPLLAEVDYDFIGNLDADMSLPPDYYEEVLRRFAQRPRLGLAGGFRFDFNGDTFVRVRQSNVSGATQFFRRACFEQIGGYRPLRYGGIDTVAELMCQLAGWEVARFEDLPTWHHRPTGAAVRRRLQICYYSGIREYSLGYHPLFMVLRCLRRASERPWGVSAVARAVGYVSALVRGIERTPPPEVVHYLRRKQLEILCGGLWRGSDR